MAEVKQMPSPKPDAASLNAAAAIRIPRKFGIRLSHKKAFSKLECDVCGYRFFPGALRK